MKELIVVLLGVLVFYILVGKWSIRYLVKKLEKFLKSYEYFENIF